MTNLNAMMRLACAALLFLAGLALVVYGAVQNPMAGALMAYGASMVAGSGLCAWDTHIS